ncbi:hypothetical protein RHS01_07420 [Rhizoctonia solani]|uniref:Uncharacterized protein n=1 Tax=Rhizoctonia solani TaxID=456999 RepID=A0A8H7LZZ7_9AGAM|nr:hypothetical protein RHS01_07420 [Rhizoctonia solani]
MTDNPGPKGTRNQLAISGILRRSTRSTSDLTSIHAHDISSPYSEHHASRAQRSTHPVYQRQTPSHNGRQLFQESEQIRDAGEGFERLAEHTSDDDSEVGTPKKKPMHDLTWNPEDQHWLDRLEDGAYPCDDALQCALKYSQITAKVIRSIINNRVTQDETTSEQNTTINFLKEIAKMYESTFDHAERTNGNGPRTRLGQHQTRERMGTYDSPYTTDNPFIDFDPTSGLLNPNPITPSTLNTDNTILNQILKKLEQLDNINTRLSRLEGAKPQAKPAQTTQPASGPKPTQNSSNPTNVSWADVAAKGNTKAPEVKASNIASASRGTLRNPHPHRATTGTLSFALKPYPSLSPTGEHFCVHARVPGRREQNACPVESIGSHQRPHWMGGPAQRMRNRDELTQLLRDSFPEEAKFGDLKITLSPDWLADPVRLQAEGRQASTVSFAFEDVGGITRTAYSQTHNIHIRTVTPKDNAAPRNLAATSADATPTPPTNTTPTTAPDAYGTAKGTRANAYTARHAASTDTGSTPRMPKNVGIPPPNNANHCKPVDGR